MFDLSADSLKDVTPILLPALVLFVGIAVSRRLSDRAFANLSQEQQETALYVAATVRRVALLVVMAVALVAIVTSMYWLGLAGLVVYFGFVTFESARRLRPLVPAECLRFTLMARGVVLAALVASIGLFMLLR